VTYLLIATRCVLGLVFAVSAFSKLRSPAAFRAGLADLDVVPRATVGPIAALAGAAAAAGVETLPPVPGALLSSFAGLVVALLVVGFDELADLVAAPVRR
jgi:methylamine utilization protein MauE